MRISDWSSDVCSSELLPPSKWRGAELNNVGLACCTLWCFVGHWPARCVERPAHRIWALLAIDVVEISRHAHATSPIGKTLRAPLSRAVAWAASRPTFVPRWLS